MSHTPTIEPAPIILNTSQFGNVHGHFGRTLDTLKTHTLASDPDAQLSTTNVFEIVALLLDQMKALSAFLACAMTMHFRTCSLDENNIWLKDAIAELQVQSLECAITVHHNVFEPETGTAWAGHGQTLGMLDVA